MADLTGHATASADLRAQVRNTLQRLSRTGELPSLPKVTTAALAIARCPDADVTELCEVIQADVGISARLLLVANSTVYGRRVPARRLRDVLTTLGLAATCDVLVAASLHSLYQTRHPRARQFWEHALAVALAAEEVARLTHSVPRGTAFLPGLLHDVGRIALLLSDPEPLDVIEHLSGAPDAIRTRLEDEWYGFDHATVGNTLAQDWGLPLDVCEAIRWHHVPSRASTGRELAEVLRVADSVAHDIGFGGGLPPPPVVDTPYVVLSAADRTICEEQTLAAFQSQKQLFV